MRLDLSCLHWPKTGSPKQKIIHCIANKNRITSIAELIIFIHITYRYTVGNKGCSLSVQSHLQASFIAQHDFSFNTSLSQCRVSLISFLPPVNGMRSVPF